MTLLKMKLMLYLSVSLLLHSTHADQQCSRDATDDAGEDENVKLTFYNMPESDWKKAEDDFASAFVKSANKYCDSKPSKCGLQNSNTAEFTDSLVLFTDDTPEIDKNDAYSTYVYVYLAYRSTMTIDGDACVVPGSGVRAIMTEYRRDIGEETGYHIVGIGSDVYTIPPNGLVNAALISVAFITLFLVIVIAIGCYCWKQRQGKMARHNQKKEKLGQDRLKQGKVFQTVESAAAVYDPPGQDCNSKQSYKQSSASNLLNPVRHVNGRGPRDTKPLAINQFRDEDFDSGTRSMGACPPYEAPPTAVFQVAEAPTANSHLNTIEETSEKKKKHKKHKKHKRRHEEPERDGEEQKQYNIATDTSLRMTGTDSDNEERQ